MTPRLDDQIPDRVRRGVEDALSDATGSRYSVAAIRTLGGGSINRAARVECRVGDGRPSSFFVKWNRSAPSRFFEVEVEGLRTLRRADSGLRVPEPIGCDREGELAWLVLEYVAPGSEDHEFGGRLAEGLARLHRAAEIDEPDVEAVGSAMFGWDYDNYIGPLPQPNPRVDSWGAFWRDARILPQLEQGWRAGRIATSPVWDALLEVLEPVLDPLSTGPSLLHGDLWSGNVFPDGEGRPTLVDPAVYCGDAFVDLAMSRLFGGFPSDFTERYCEARFAESDPAADSTTHPVRIAVHQLYPLLVHANLFGGGYANSAERAARAVLSATG